MTAPLQAPLELEFAYTRSLGPVLGRFVAGLGQRRITGVRGCDGRVHVPPVEYDPVSFSPLHELVEVADTGVVVGWSWQATPLEGQPLDRPFAWALIRLDGADTAMLHAVDCGSPDAIATGTRVRVRWAAEPAGHIRDIACFDPLPAPNRTEALAEASAPPQAAAKPSVVARPEATAGSEAAASPEPAPVGIMTTPIRLHYRHSASPEESRYLRGLAEGRLLGQRCPRCRKVYVPPRGACPTDGVPTTDEVELPDRGILTTFCVVNVPFPGQRIEPPYVTGYVLLDGADIGFLHLVLGCPAEEVRMGMRVEAVWRPRDEWGHTLRNIDHFRPTDEPDAPFDSFAGHL
ncbi:MAG: OB-fold domain-containing protein [Micromonosporaceae bacterium]